jgi:diaminohydroxyphosphoribosylaminopyrimidine deaminase/5-amino-6-(5-phosphoribosylamino)uracil reductase
VSNFSAFDEVAMRRALELAARGLYSTYPNPRVGAVLARDNEIVGEGWHERPGEAHAEPNAIRAAGERARGATAYVTLEPCSHHGRTPPCADVLIAVGVRRLVYAIADPNPRVNGAGARKLIDAGITVESGLMEREAEALNAGFLMRMRKGRPFVRLKSAASLDGRTALASGASKWITSEAARADVQHWRAQSGAILTSAATVLADDPRLDVRIEAPQQPLRVVLDRRRQVPKSARILRPPGEALLFSAASARRVKGADERLGAARVERVRVTRNHLDLRRVLKRLGELEINDVLVEAGPKLAGALLAARLVDEWLLYVAPMLLGDRAKPLAVLGRLTKMSAAPQFELLECLQVGPDLRLRLQPGRPNPRNQ